MEYNIDACLAQRGPRLWPTGRFEKLMTYAADRSTTKPDLAAVKQAALTPAPEVVASIRAVLGARLTALISGVKDARTIDAWTHGKVKIPDLAYRRLQIAYAAALTLKARYEADAIASWFTWLAEALDDRSPAAVLADTTKADVESKGREIVRAARSHLTE